MSFKTNQSLNKKNLMILAAVIVVGIIGLYGVRKFILQHSDRPLAQGVVKSQIFKLLKKEAGQTDFTTSLEWYLSTNTDGATVTNAEAADSNGIKVPNPNLSRQFRTLQEAAASYSVIYRLIGEQLWAADQLLAMQDPLLKQSGLIQASEASRHALYGAVNSWLAARIAEAYLLPNLQVLKDVNKPVVTAQNLLELADTIFKSGYETNNLIRVYRLSIELSPRPDQVEARIPPPELLVVEPKALECALPGVGAACHRQPSRQLARHQAGERRSHAGILAGPPRLRWSPSTLTGRAVSRETRR